MKKWLKAFGKAVLASWVVFAALNALSLIMKHYPSVYPIAVFMTLVIVFTCWFRGKL